MTTERVFYADAAGEWHIGMLDGLGMEVMPGHVPDDGREVYHELPDYAEQLCTQCFGTIGTAP